MPRKSRTDNVRKGLRVRNVEDLHVGGTGAAGGARARKREGAVMAKATTELPAGSLISIERTEIVPRRVIALITVIFFFMTLLTLIPTASFAQSETSPHDEDAINKIIRQWHESFERRSADLRNELLTEDTVFFNAFGVEREGRESVTAFWKELFASGTFNQSNITVPKQTIRFLRPDLAIVDRFEEVTGQRGIETGRSLPPRRVHLTFIMTKATVGWLVAYYRAGDLRDPDTAR